MHATVAQVVARASATASAQALCLTSCSVAGGSIDGTEVKQLLLLLGIQASPEQVSAMIAGKGRTKHLTALTDCSRLVLCTFCSLLQKLTRTATAVWTFRSFCRSAVQRRLLQPQALKCSTRQPVQPHACSTRQPLQPHAVQIVIRLLAFAPSRPLT